MYKFSSSDSMKVPKKAIENGIILLSRNSLKKLYKSQHQQDFGGVRRLVGVGEK